MRRGTVLASAFSFIASVVARYMKCAAAHFTPSMMMYFMSTFLPAIVERSQDYVVTSSTVYPKIRAFIRLTRHSQEGYIVPQLMWDDAGGKAERIADLM